MSGIRGKDTKMELVIRKSLHARGYRYRLHDRRLPGAPDIVFPSRKAVIFVHGCFWHGHDCHLFKWPTTRAVWWRAKIEGNRTRDKIVREQFANLKWRQMRLWECALKGTSRLEPELLLESVVEWLEGNDPDKEIKG